MDTKQFKERWLITARGYILFLLAVILFFNYYMTISQMSIYLGISLLITGGMITYTTLKNFKLNNKNIWFHAEGFLDILAAIFVLIFSNSTGPAIYIIFGLWAIATGSLQLVLTYNVMRTIELPIWVKASIDLVMVILGLLVIIVPSSSITLEHTLMGLFLMIYGVVFIVESFQLQETKNYSV